MWQNALGIPVLFSKKILKKLKLDQDQENYKNIYLYLYLDALKSNMAH